jgi:hypothetical protein
VNQIKSITFTTDNIARRVKGLNAVAKAGCTSGKHLDEMIFTEEFSRRFWQKVEITKDSECWLWNACSINGYGIINVGGRNALAHRVSWAIANKRLDVAGKVVMHKCNTPLCVNPRHLELGTQKENLDQAVRQLRMGKFFTDSQVSEIRQMALAGQPIKTIAAHYGTGLKPIEKVVYNERSIDPSYNTPFRGYSMLGEFHRSARLTTFDVMRARSMWAYDNVPILTIAKDLGIAYSSCHNMIHGQTWAHLPILSRTPKKKNVA